MGVLDGAHGLRTHQRGGVVDDLLDQRPSPALGAEQAGAGDAHAGEAHVGQAQVVEAAVLADRDARRAALDEEDADAVCVALATGRAGRDHEQVGAATVQDRALVALEHPAVAGRGRARAHARQLVARARLGLRKRHLRLAGNQRRQDLLLLGDRPATRDEPAAEADGREVRLDHERLAKRLHHDHHVHRVAAEAAVLRVERHAEDAHLGHGRPHVLAEARGRGDDLGARVEAVAGVQELAQGLGEEPLLVAVLEVHVVPPPTGRGSPWR